MLIVGEGKCLRVLYVILSGPGAELFFVLLRFLCSSVAVILHVRGCLVSLVVIAFMFGN